MGSVTVTAKRQAIVPLGRFRYGCLADGTYFEGETIAHGDSGYSYARTPSGLMVALSYDADPLQRELFGLVERALKKRGRRIRLNLAALHNVDSAALDPAPNGERYRMGRPPPCPNAHDPDEYVFAGRPVEPRIVFDGVLDLADHDAWDALSPAQKEQQVERIVADTIAHEKERKEREDQQLRRYRELQAQGAFRRTPGF